MEEVDFDNIEFIIIVQCSIAKKRCSGYACISSFYSRQGTFKNYDKNKEIKYISFECGGCCGKGVSSYFGHFVTKMSNDMCIPKEKIAVHLSSCMTTDNHHYDRCPHLDYIKDIIFRKYNFKNIIEGSYIWSGSEKLRELGIYKKY